MCNTKINHVYGPKTILIKQTGKTAKSSLNCLLIFKNEINAMFAISRIYMHFKTFTTKSVVPYLFFKKPTFSARLKCRDQLVHDVIKKNLLGFFVFFSILCLAGMLIFSGN